jgi:hypothetical protein
MTSLIAYRKLIDNVTTHTLRLPEPAPGQQAAQELATLLDGRTVVALFEGYALAQDQPEAIAASIEVLPAQLPDLLREEIKAASPHVALIARRMIEQIRASYTPDDEMYLARIGVGAALGMYSPSSNEMQELTVYGEFVEAVRQWGRAERARLGLGS